MAAFKPIDPKRDEFRRYLERSGVIEALTKAFVRLVREQEKPADAIQFLRHNLGDHLHENDNVVFLKEELTEARSTIQRLRQMIERIDPDALQKMSVPATEDLSMTKSGVKESDVTTANAESPRAATPAPTESTTSDSSDDAELIPGEVSKEPAVDNCQTSNTSSSNSEPES